MASFILNRPDDYLTLSRGKIIATSLMWFFFLWIGSLILLMACVRIYNSVGFSMEQIKKLTEYRSVDFVFKLYKGKPLGLVFLIVVFLGPLMEEVLFRLGLSFKRIDAAIWVGLLPALSAFCFVKSREWYFLLALAAVGAVLFWLICRFTTDDQWKAWRTKYIIPAMWMVAIVFCLIHLTNFVSLSLMVIPLALTMILPKMATSSAITYLRVNLGFWWGVLFHSASNLIALLLYAASHNMLT